MPRASSSARTPMFRIPQIMRMANPKAFRPLFHLGPYAPEFFPPLTCITANSSRYSSSGGGGTPMGLAQNEECSLPSSTFNYDVHLSCFREFMARDMSGDEVFESLVGKLKAGAMLKEITDMYPELPNTIIAAIPRETLARLFASSAIIIAGSALSLIEIDLIRNAAPPATMRHPFINRLYAVVDAIRMMENQVPVSLLKLACETFCVDECRLRDLQHRLHVSVENHLSGDMLLLVHVLWKCLSLATPFHVKNRVEDAKQVQKNRMEDAKQLQNIASWIERNPHKSVMAYIYDSLTGRVSGTDEAGNAVKGGHDAGEQLKRIMPASQIKRMRSASQLRRYGVTFHSSTDVTSHNNFEAITYDSKSRKLMLPRMAIRDDLPSFLCNLMAYEATVATRLESCPHMVYHVSSFVIFLDCLIDTEEDVELLVEAEVLRNTMARSNARVAMQFDGLDRSLYVRLTPEIEDIMKNLRHACKVRWRGWWVSFKEAYWERQPWLLISMAAATVLLVLTTLQTIYAARS